MNWRELPKEEWWVEGFYVQLPKFSFGATIVTGGDLCAEDVADYIIVNNRKQHSNFSNVYPLEVVECEQYEVDPETICEYTGKTDKKGTKIWENDICKVGEFIFKVVFKNSHWDFEIISGRTYCNPWFDSHCGDYCEVIGNIFDNLELLEGDEAE